MTNLVNDNNIIEMAQVKQEIEPVLQPFKLENTIENNSLVKDKTIIYNQITSSRSNDVIMIDKPKLKQRGRPKTLSPEEVINRVKIATKKRNIKNKKQMICDLVFYIQNELMHNITKEDITEKIYNKYRINLK